MCNRQGLRYGLSKKMESNSTPTLRPPTNARSTVPGSTALPSWNDSINEAITQFRLQEAFACVLSSVLAIQLSAEKLLLQFDFPIPSLRGGIPRLSRARDACIFHPDHTLVQPNRRSHSQKRTIFHYFLAKAAKRASAARALLSRSILTLVASEIPLSLAIFAGIPAPTPPSPPLPAIACVGLSASSAIRLDSAAFWAFASAS